MALAGVKHIGKVGQFVNRCDVEGGGVKGGKLRGLLRGVTTLREVLKV